MIDIAQRGRSWGVHLVLATQQPTRDVVVPKVRSNVNARIALRTLSADDSVTIIDRPDATRIPRALPGRAMARAGLAACLLELAQFEEARSQARRGFAYDAVPETFRYVSRVADSVIVFRRDSAARAAAPVPARRR